MSQNWKENPKLKSMNPEKLKLLSDFAEQIRNTPKNQLLTAFTSLNVEAQKNNIQFSDQETELLASILTANMDASQRKKLDTLRLLSKKLTK